MNRVASNFARFRMLLQIGVLSVLLQLCQLSQAAVSLNAGSGQVTPGGTVTIPITATGSWSEQWVSADFTLTWSAGVLSVTDNSSSGPFSNAGFSQPSAGVGKFSWFSSAGASTVPNGATLINLTFTADAGATPGTYPISFASNSGDTPLVIGFKNATPPPDTFTLVPDTISGSIEVVPEPVNIALGVFGLVFASTAFYRSFRRKSTTGPVNHQD